MLLFKFCLLSQMNTHCPSTSSSAPSESRSYDPQNIVTQHSKEQNVWLHGARGKDIGHGVKSADTIDAESLQESLISQVTTWNLGQMMTHRTFFLKYLPCDRMPLPLLLTLYYSYSYFPPRTAGPTLLETSCAGP